MADRGKSGKMDEHHRIARNIGGPSTAENIMLVDRELHKLINSIEALTRRVAKRSNSSIELRARSLNEVRSTLKEMMRDKFLPTTSINIKNPRYLVKAGSVPPGLVDPCAPDDMTVLYRNFSEKDSWDKKRYGRGIDMDKSTLSSILSGSPYIALGSPDGYSYYVDIIYQKSH
ncbi:MAG: hypothetical protein QMD78_06945 [Methanocellales archaeon]|nr:hypothetical protein [Methanocellales archaeon]